MHSASKLGTLNKLIYYKKIVRFKKVCCNLFDYYEPQVLQLFSTIVMQNDFVSILR